MTRGAAAARADIAAHRRAPSVQVDGRLVDDSVSTAATDDGLRPPRGGRGEVRCDNALSEDFALLVKHNALFAALLAPLAAAFPVIGLVRNPVAVLASWQTVGLPVRQGRIPAGERFAPELRRALACEPDVLRRQVRVLDWFFARFAAHLAPARVLRYVDLVASGGLSLLRLLAPAAAAPTEPLCSRNANGLYDPATVDTLHGWPASPCCSIQIAGLSMRDSKAACSTTSLLAHMARALQRFHIRLRSSCSTDVQQLKASKSR